MGQINGIAFPECLDLELDPSHFQDGKRVVVPVKLHTSTLSDEENPCRNKGFVDFTWLCRDAYRILQRHSNLLLILLAIMLLFVRKTLAVELHYKEEALNYFNVKFNEAHRGVWITEIDWFAHWLRR
ncbi:unnamed protein product [Taenia asiatica]|uniref:Transmembrane protein n=1 Tax=Taenia asiatica TaxID=60517 RepID=A0A0R3VWR1_TAEAS|nr:unnamed protein product [Taenia asiatica]